MYFTSIILVDLLLHRTLASPHAKPRSNDCCFHLSASGGPDGDVGQLSDGQNRIGQAGLTTSRAQYCLDGTGELTDDSGRGCILTSPTTQWQCDAGASPTDSFSVGCNGSLQYKGNSDFWSCPTNDNGGYNIYTQPLQGEPNCVKITLNADNTQCRSGCPSTPSPGPPQPTSTSGCPADLPAQFEFPHLILPINSEASDQSLANSYNGQACNGISSIFNFDIPSNLKGKTCTLSFLLPSQSQLQTSSFSLTGSGAVDFARLSKPATEGMTYNSKPGIDHDYGSTTLVPGHAYTLDSWPCPAGDRIGIWMSPRDDTCFTEFQDYNPCPIGLYITSA